MYEYICGKVCKTAADYAVLECGGIGYHICCSAHSLSALELDKIGKLYIFLHVAEDEMSMYGFISESERDAFRMLISVSKIGKRTALAILSVLTVDDLRLAIITENAHALEEIPGIGKKTAQRILLELKEKFSGLGNTSNGTANIGATASESTKSMRTEAIEALVSMGFDGMTASRAVTKIDDSAFDGVEKLIKLALVVATEG